MMVELVMFCLFLNEVHTIILRGSVVWEWGIEIHFSIYFVLKWGYIIYKLHSIIFTFSVFHDARILLHIS